MEKSVKQMNAAERGISVGTQVFCHTGQFEIRGRTAKVVWVSKTGKLLNVKGQDGGIHEIRTSSVRTL